MKEEDKSKQEELDRREEEPNCRCSLQPVKRAGNSSFKLKNAVLNNFDGHVFKYISNHE